MKTRLTTASIVVKTIVIECTPKECEGLYQAVDTWRSVMRKESTEGYRDKWATIGNDLKCELAKLRE